MNEVMEQDWTAFRATDATPEERRLSDEFERALGTYRRGARASLLELIRSEHVDIRPELNELLTRSYQADVLPMEKMLTRLTEIQQEAAAGELAESERLYGLLVRTFAVACLGVLLMAGGYAVWMSRRLNPGLAPPVPLP